MPFCARSCSTNRVSELAISRYRPAAGMESCASVARAPRKASQAATTVAARVRIMSRAAGQGSRSRERNARETNRRNIAGAVTHEGDRRGRARPTTGCTPKRLELERLDLLRRLVGYLHL